MIIDCYVGNNSKPLAGKEFGMAGVEKLLRDAGVERAVIMPEVTVRPKNRELAEEIASKSSFRAMFTGSAFVNPQFGDESIREFELAIKELGFCCLKLMPTHHAFRCVTPAAHPLMRKAEELNVPVLIHSGTFFAHPLEIGVLADAFPNVTVLMDHMGYRYYTAEAVAAAKRSPNLHLVTSIVMEPHIIRQAVKAIGADRVLYASNAPLAFPVTQIQVIRLAELSEADERKVLGDNAARIFRLK
jgi:hypothetical protein